MFAPRCDVAGNTERCPQKTLQQKMEYRDFWTWRAYRDTNRESFWSARFAEHHGMPGKQKSLCVNDSGKCQCSATHWFERPGIHSVAGPRFAVTSNLLAARAASPGARCSCPLRLLSGRGVAVCPADGVPGGARAAIPAGDRNSVALSFFTSRGGAGWTGGIVETRMVRCVTPVNSCIWLRFSGNHCRSGGI